MLFVAVTVKLVAEMFVVPPSWPTLTVKITTWASVGVQLKVVGPVGPGVLNGERLASGTLGLLVRPQLSGVVAPVVFVRVT